MYVYNIFTEYCMITMCHSAANNKSHSFIWVTVICHFPWILTTTITGGSNIMIITWYKMSGDYCKTLNWCNLKNSLLNSSFFTCLCLIVCWKSQFSILILHNSLNIAIMKLMMFLVKTKPILQYNKCQDNICELYIGTV